ncbi:MAG TPA: CocE/NonD family hydrolase, partial [Egibacteraceae bacterium]|nr:CocE/NonD family hydrolase [Egibacteraceae bacterium]
MAAVITRRRVAALVALCLAASLLSAVTGTPAQAAPTDYVRVSDGALIAINVDVPEHCTKADPCPTVFEMAGYENGSADGKTPAGDIADATGLPLPLQCGSRCSHSVFFDRHYVTIQASVRGTGCSTGEFDLFSWRSALDGREIIDGWIAKQPWSNGEVAIFGHSYSGITGTMVAATQPRHLKAVSVSGLIDDLYRGIVYMGGVSNMGFPLLWTGIYRPSSEYQNGVIPGVRSGDRTCIANQATRYPPDVLDNPILNGAAGVEDSQWWASHSTITYLDGINVPTHIVQSYQDEQTGPRGSNLLWQRLDERKPELPKRLLLTNGVHSTNTAPPEIRDDR